MNHETEFYCEECGITSYVERLIVTTEGFEVECPNCHEVFWFSCNKVLDAGWDEE